MGQATYNEIGGPGGYLAHEEPFEGNTMRAARVSVAQNVKGLPHPHGRTPSDVAEWFRQDRDQGGVRYVVWSYATIIAWVTTGGTVCIPDEGYSVTTSRQQNLCRAWLARHTREGVLS